MVAGTVDTKHVERSRVEIFSKILLPSFSGLCASVAVISHDEEVRSGYERFIVACTGNAVHRHFKRHSKGVPFVRRGRFVTRFKDEIHEDMCSIDCSVTKVNLTGVIAVGGNDECV